MGGGLMDLTTAYKRIDSMSAPEVDSLNLGAIQLDTSGKILTYNRFESEFARLKPSEVLGRNFFRDIAPCTDVKEFAGRFREGCAKKELTARFAYRFVFRNQPPRNVVIVMHYSRVSNTVWVFVQPVAENAGAAT